MLRKVKTFFFQFIESLIRNISGIIGVKIRRAYYSKRLGGCGQNLRIDEGVIIEGVKNIFIGENVWIDKYCILMAGKINIKKDKVNFKKNELFNYNEGDLYLGSQSHLSPYCIIQAYAGVEIGDYFTASASAKIYSLSNDVNNCKKGTYFSNDISYLKSQIIIKENVWLGINATILGGLIGKNTFIGPNSVVFDDVEDNSFVVGMPAKKIKDKFI